MKPQLLDRLRRLPEEQLYRELYCDSLTGILNRTAFDQDRSIFVALVDLDSLKFINDAEGYRSGDAYLQTVAQSLVETFGQYSVYRLSGDEFVVCSDHARKLHDGLHRLQNQVPTFSFGIGTTIGQADKLLKLDKRQREASGERAQRGEAPPWLKDKAKKA